MKGGPPPARSRPAAVLQLRSSAGLYGADRMVLTLNGALADIGTESRLLSINNYRMQAQELHEAAVADAQSTELLACRKRLDMATLGQLVASIRRHGAGIVHAHDYKSATYAWVASLRTPVRLVATMHGQVDATRALRLYNRLELALLRRFDALAVVSARQVGLLEDAGIPRSRIHLIDNGIPLASADTDPGAALQACELGLDGRAFVFAAVARFSPEKNLGLLLEAFAIVAGQHRDCELMLVGDGPMADELKRRCVRLGIDKRVHFTGVRRDMPAVYAHMDCLVLSSLSEGMPLTVLEAMSHGIPVIATRVGEVPRLLSGTDHGRIVPSADLAALASAMRERVAAGRAHDATARQRVRSQHSPEAMAIRYRDLYRSLGGTADDARAA